MGSNAFNAACVIFVLLSVCFADRVNVSVQVPVTDATVYSNGFAFIKRSNTLNLTGGEISLLIKNFTPSGIVDSISVSDDKGGVREVSRYELVNQRTDTRYLTFDEILNGSAGSSIRALTKNGWQSGVLSWFSPDKLGIKVEDKLVAIRFADIEQLETPYSTYKQDVVINETERGLRIDERSTGGTHKISMSYLVPYVTWNVNYKYYISSDADMGDGSMQAWADVSNNAGEDWDNVRLKVVVGYPHMFSYYPINARYESVSAYAPKAMTSDVGGSAIPGFVSSFLGEYYVYTLGDPITLKNGETRNLALFENPAKFRSQYIWDTTWERPHKVYKINNTGDQSWGSGTARIYMSGDFIGEDSIAYTPRGKEAEVTIADVPELVVKKQVNSTAAEEYKSARTTTYKVTLSLENTKDEDVELTVRDWMNSGDVVELSASSIPPKRDEQNKLEWTVHLNKGETSTINYTYTTTSYYYY